LKRAAPAIRHATFIRAPVGRVFETLTTARGWDGWFTRGTSLEARPGGRLLLRWKNFGADRVTASDGGPVLEVRANRRFAFQWSPRGFPTKVTFDLEKQGRGTLVSVTETGYPLSRQGVETLVWCATGWGEALTLLKFFLEHNVRYGTVPPARAGCGGSRRAGRSGNR
jgi:uncharacterized protein YndB with AHSA1/START domain